jgi:hypothetical protein
VLDCSSFSMRCAEEFKLRNRVFQTLKKVFLVCSCMQRFLPVVKNQSIDLERCAIDESGGLGGGALFAREATSTSLQTFSGCKAVMTMKGKFSCYLASSSSADFLLCTLQRTFFVTQQHF